MAKVATRTKQLTNSINGVTPNLTALGTRLNHLYLFSKVDHRIVGIYRLNNANEITIPQFEMFAQSFTKKTKDYLIMASRSNNVINDNCHFICDNGVWSCVDSGVYSNVLSDMQYLFSVHSAAITNAQVARLNLYFEGSPFGLEDILHLQAYSSGRSDQTQAREAAIQRQGLQSAQQGLSRSSDRLQGAANNMQSVGMFGCIPNNLKY